MTFIESLIASGYVFDDEDYDGCYVKQDSEGFIHCYQEHEEDGLWNYVKMTDEFDVVFETTVSTNVDSICFPNSAKMTQVSFTSGELLDIIKALEIQENAFFAEDYNLAAYYMNLGVQFQRIYDKLQEMPGERRVANLVLAMN